MAEGVLFEKDRVSHRRGAGGAAFAAEMRPIFRPAPESRGRHFFLKKKYPPHPEKKTRGDFDFPPGPLETTKGRGFGPLPLETIPGASHPMEEKATCIGPLAGETSEIGADQTCGPSSGRAIHWQTKHFSAAFESAASSS